MFGRLARRLASRREHRRLVKLVLGDQQAAERLIAYELKRSPWLTREEATHRALERLVHERTR